MPDKKISDLGDGGDPQATDEFVVARGGDNFKLAWSSLSNAATRNNVALTLDGNTAGALALVSTGTLTLAGGNNITVSQAGNAVTISGANPAAATAISGLGNSETTYTSGTVNLSGLGAITVRSTTGQAFELSVAAQSVQPETQTFIGGISASDTLYTSGTVRFTGSQAVTVRSGTGQLVVIDVPTQSVQPETQTFVGGIANSQTTYTSGTVSLSELGAITIRSTTGNQFQLSVNAQSAQTGISGIANSQTTYTSGTVSLSELGAITIRSTTGNQYQLSVNAQTVQTQGILSAGLSNLGNTAGSTGVTGTRLVLVGTNQVSLSQSTDANGGTVTVNVPQVVLSELQPRSHLLMAATQGIGASAATQTTVTAYVMPMSLPQDLAFNNLFLAANVSFTSATTSISSINYSFSQGASLGFYSLNGSTMSLVTSFSQTLGFTNATSANATDLKATGDVAWGGSHQSIVITGAASMSSIMSSIQGVRKLPLVWSTQSLTLTRGQYWAVACFSALTGGNNQASLSQIGMVSSMSIMGSAYNPPAMMKSTASVTSPFIFFGQATLVNSSDQLMPASFNTNAITVSTNTNASTKFQSVWFQIYSSHSN